jgi:hypothetical protein
MIAAEIFLRVGTVMIFIQFLNHMIQSSAVHRLQFLTISTKSEKLKEDVSTEKLFA